MMQMIMGKMVSRAITAAADLEIADHLAGGPRSARDLAAATNASEDALYRVLRALAAVGVFHELPERRFENNPLSATLRKSAPDSTWAMARWINDPAGWLPWGRLDHSVKTGQPASTEVFQTQDLFGWLRDHPSSLETFQTAMTGFSGMTGAAVAKAYDFSPFKKLVDVGGGHGALLGHILTQFGGGLSGVLYDRPEVVAHARPTLEAMGQAARIEVLAGDFFQGVPAGADAYIMKAIIHDWDDERCAVILSNCRKVMAPGGKILIADAVLSDRPEATMAKIIDLEMLVMTHGGRERTAEEFAALLARAGLKLSRIVPTESPVSVVEAVAG
jgi:hypothetical protein